MTIKDQADFPHFSALDIRVGTILAVEAAATRKPAWRMTIDFGGEIGRRTSCGAYTNYMPEEMVGRQVVAVVNFAVKKMGPERSEALVLGVADPDGPGTIFLTTERPVPPGREVF